MPLLWSERREANTISLNSQCIIGVNQVSPMRGKGISIALTVRSLDPRLPGLVCGVMVGIGLLVVNFLRVYGKCWVPVRLETAPTGIVE